MKDNVENNVVCLAGKIDLDFRYNHSIFGEDFYFTEICVERQSGRKDRFPLMMSDRLIDLRHFYKGCMVTVTGQLRSYNWWDGEKRRLEIFVFVKEMTVIGTFTNNETSNQIFLDGYLCKEVVYRKTPLGREIADLCVAVNRLHGKSDYIPCIAWGRDARYARRLSTGSRVHITGRFQSREYEKRLDDGTLEIRTAYEVSIKNTGVIAKEEEKLFYPG